MTPSDFSYGFRIEGSPYEPRKVVDAGLALAGYACCDPRAECGSEGYLSAFRFAADFQERADKLTGIVDTKGFAGPCWSPWLWFDIDCEGDRARAQAETEALADVLTIRYQVDGGDLLLFFSGSKGFHVGLVTCLWSPAPSADFHKACRRFAEHVGELAGVTIDNGVYDKVRAFRARTLATRRPGFTNAA